MAVAQSEYQLLARNPGDSGSVLRWILFVPLAVVFVLIAIVVSNASQGIPSGGFLSPEVWVFLSISGAIVVLVVFGVLAVGPGAIRCIWCDSGFVLRYGNGRERSFAWNDSQFRLRVVEYDDKNGLVTYEINQGVPAHNPIPKDLYLAIFAEARRRSLSVHTRTATIPSGKMTINDISNRR